MVLNGHLDTFPVGDASRWSHGPLEGALHAGRIYGRGAGDMKAGVAILVQVLLTLADEVDAMHGEVFLLLVGDEETGGKWGTGYLLEHEPAATGEISLNADASNPTVVRIGEKGISWYRLTSTGRACHGAHVHRGDNAIESLMAALSDIVQLRDAPTTLPKIVVAAMAQARAVSEAMGGAGMAGAHADAASPRWSAGPPPTTWVAWMSMWRWRRSRRCSTYTWPWCGSAFCGRARRHTPLHFEP